MSSLSSVCSSRSSESSGSSISQVLCNVKSRFDVHGCDSSTDSDNTAELVAILKAKADRKQSKTTTVKNVNLSVTPPTKRSYDDMNQEMGAERVCNVAETPENDDEVYDEDTPTERSSAEEQYLKHCQSIKALVTLCPN